MSSEQTVFRFPFLHFRSLRFSVYFVPKRQAETGATRNEVTEGDSFHISVCRLPFAYSPKPYSVAVVFVALSTKHCCHVNKTVLSCQQNSVDTATKFHGQ